MLSKLITDEDPMHIHKTLGLLTLSNYAFQTVYYVNYGEMYNIDKLIYVHICLHLSSFVFKVLSKRPKEMDKMKMFIWEELRLHSMIFAYRSCFSILYPDFSKAIVFLTMMAADTATHYVGDAEFTTVRGRHERPTKSLAKQAYSIFFSTSQMGATAICSGCFQDSYSKFLTFQTLIPIQTSAFGLTLLRKNIINKTVWQVVYTIELSLVYVWWYYIYRSWYIIPMSVVPYLLRRAGVPKYAIWLLFIIGDDLRNVFMTYMLAYQ